MSTINASKPNLVPTDMKKDNNNKKKRKSFLNKAPKSRKKQILEVGQTENTEVAYNLINNNEEYELNTQGIFQKEKIKKISNCNLEASSSKNEEKVMKCPVCEEIYQDETPYMIRCESCISWVHSRCAGLSRSMYKKLDSKMGQCELFYCPACCSSEVRKNKVRSLLNFVGAEINPYFKYLTKSSRKQGPILMDIKGKLKTSYIKSNGKFERYNRSCRNKINGHMEELGILIKPPDAYMAFRNIIQATLPHIPVEQLKLIAIREWLCMNESEKRKYITAAEKSMKEYRNTYLYKTQLDKQKA